MPFQFAGLASQPPTPPNIILILADDLDLKLDTVTTMPNLQALLADQGVTFSNFFTNALICCPSRASLFRGQYVHNHAVYTNGPPGGGFETFRDLGLENDTIATACKMPGIAPRCLASISTAIRLEVRPTTFQRAGTSGMPRRLPGPDTISSTTH